MKKSEAIKVDEHIYKFTPSEKMACNTYLVEGKPMILIDAGIKIEGIKPDIVVITHCHHDHMGFARYYEELGAKVYVDSKEREFFKDLNKVNSFDFKVELPDKLHSVKEGDTVENSNYRFKVLEVPGHTPGGIALWDADHSVLFSGDVWKGKNVTGSITFGDYTKLKASVKRLKALKPKVLCAGHNINLKSAVICSVGNIVFAVTRKLGITLPSKKVYDWLR